MCVLVWLCLRVCACVGNKRLERVEGEVGCRQEGRKGGGAAVR